MRSTKRTVVVGRGRGLALLMVLLFAGRAAAGGGGYVTFRLPIKLDGVDVASDIYLRVRESRPDLPLSALAKEARDPRLAFLGRIMDAVKRNDLKTFTEYSPEPVRKESKRLIKAIRREVKYLQPTKVGGRFDVGNLSFFILDKDGAGGREVPIVVIDDGGTLRTVDYGEYAITQILADVWMLRGAGRREFEPAKSPGGEYMKVALPLRFSVRDNGYPRSVLVKEGPEVANAAYVLLKAKLVNVVSRVEAVQAAKVTGAAKEVLLAYARSRQAVRDDDYDAFVASFTRKSQPWVRHWLKRLGPAGWKMMMHKPDSQPERVWAMIDAGQAWIVINSDEEGTAYPGPFFAYQVLVRAPKSKHFLRTHFWQMGGIDGILRQSAFFTAFTHRLGLLTRCKGDLCVSWPGD